MSLPTHPPEPWGSFFSELDAAAVSVVRLDCIGGFVVTQLYGLDRPTSDVDVIECAPRDSAGILMKLGVQGGALHKKYRIYLDRVAVAAIPDGYEDRLIEMFPGAYERLRLMALDPYDVALSKLERNSQKDRDDVRFLARTLPMDLHVLEERYRTELRWKLGVAKREDLTLQLWLEAIQEERAEKSERTIRQDKK